MRISSLYTRQGGEKTAGLFKYVDREQGVALSIDTVLLYFLRFLLISLRLSTLNIIFAVKL